MSFLKDPLVGVDQGGVGRVRFGSLMISVSNPKDPSVLKILRQ